MQTLIGYMLAVTQFVTQLGKNCFENVVLDLWNNGLFVHNTN